MKDALLFVYGTLMKGHENHHVLKRIGAKFVREAATKPRCELFDVGHFPALTEHGSTSVAGELYHVPGYGFQDLDRLESVPYLYRRGFVVLEDGDIVQTYIYARPTNGLSKIYSGDWRQHV